MIGPIHVAFHVGLCNAVAKLAPETVVPIRIRTIDPIGNLTQDTTVSVARGTDSSFVVNVTSDPGTYRIILQAPAYDCNAADFVTLLPDHDRYISEALSDGAIPTPEELLISGIVPEGYHVSFVLLDGWVGCDDNVSIMPSQIVVESDSTAYYARFYSDPTFDAHKPVTIAMAVTDPKGRTHYLNLKNLNVRFPMPLKMWPEVVIFDLSLSTAYSLEEASPNKLVCPKIWQTTAH